MTPMSKRSTWARDKVHLENRKSRFLELMKSPHPGRLSILLLLCAYFAGGGAAGADASGGGDAASGGAVLRIENVMHTDLVRALDVDAAQHYVVTGSPDKTVRVWSLDN